MSDLSQPGEPVHPYDLAEIGRAIRDQKLTPGVIIHALGGFIRDADPKVAIPAIRCYLDYVDRAMSAAGKSKPGAGAGLGGDGGGGGSSGVAGDGGGDIRIDVRFGGFSATTGAAAGSSGRILLPNLEPQPAPVSGSSGADNGSGQGPAPEPGKPDAGAERRVDPQ